MGDCDYDGKMIALCIRLYVDCRTAIVSNLFVIAFMQRVVQCKHVYFSAYRYQKQQTAIKTSWKLYYWQINLCNTIFEFLFRVSFFTCIFTVNRWRCDLNRDILLLIVNKNKD